MNNNPNNRPKRNSLDNNIQRHTTPRPPQQITREAVQRESSVDKKFISVVISSALAVALIITLLLSFALSRTNGCNEENEPEKNEPSIPSSSSSAVLEETSDMGQAYIDSMIFFGDSNTDHMRSYGVLSGGRDTKQVWSTASHTVTLNSEITNVKIIYPETGEEMTVPAAAALKKPEYLVISLGTNGVATLSESQFKYCYKKLINAVKEASPNTKIIVQSIYPVTSSYTGFSNEKINAANVWILDVAKETGVKYVDTASVLKDENGAMQESFNSDHLDGYHINKDAYERILQYLRTHGYQ